MKKNFKLPLKTLDKTPFQENGKDVLLSSICIHALGFTDPQGPKLPHDEHLKRFKLASKIHDAEDEIDVTVEELALLKTVIVSVGYGPLVVGSAFQILEE